jgi:formyltetrahydrofolate synthetase
VISNHWSEGGAGAIDLGRAVIEASKEKVNFKFLYPLELTIKAKVTLFHSLLFFSFSFSLSSFFFSFSSSD